MTHLGDHGGFLAAGNVDPGASAGNTRIEAAGEFGRSRASWGAHVEQLRARDIAEARHVRLQQGQSYFFAWLERRLAHHVPYRTLSRSRRSVGWRSLRRSVPMDRERRYEGNSLRGPIQFARARALIRKAERANSTYRVGGRAACRRQSHGASGCSSRHKPALFTRASSSARA